MWDLLKLAFGGKKGFIRSLDRLEQPFSELIKKAQRRSGSISADGFSKELVDEIQGKLCEWWKVDRADVGLDK